MNLGKKVIESAVVVAFVFILVVTSIAIGDLNTKADQYTKENMDEDKGSDVAIKERTEIDVVAKGEESQNKEDKETAEKNAIIQSIVMAPVINIVGDAVIPTVKEENNEVTETIPEKVVSEWDNKLMPNVENYLNIRSEAKQEAELVGKLYKGAAADILEHGEEWTKIRSGSVEGYVKNEYCVFGEQAEAMSKEYGTVYATSLTGGLRVRKKASTADDAGILHVLEEGERLEVNTKAEAVEGWVVVIYGEKTAYVSAEYVSVERELGKAISIEEEREAIRKAEQEKAERAANALRAQAAACDDLTLLAALIQCEAGGESYEGMVAVGAVVMNRLECGYGNSIYEIIFQEGQFTPVTNGTLAIRLSSDIKSSCIQAAQEALNGVDNVGGARNFRRVSPEYQGLVIGNHVFF